LHWRHHLWGTAARAPSIYNNLIFFQLTLELHKVCDIDFVRLPNSITLASSELAPNMFEAGSCQIPLH